MSTMLMDLNVDPNLYPAASITKGALEFARMRLLDAIKELTPEQLEATPAHFSNSIATLVVHIAAIEVRFSHLITGKPLPEELAREFLLDQPQSPLPVAKGETAATLQAKLEKSMGYVDEMLRGLNEEDMSRKVPAREGWEFSVQWMVGLLPMHVQQHFGQIQMLIKHLSN